MANENILFSDASLLHLEEELTIPGNLLGVFIAFKILAQDQMRQSGQNFKSFQSQVVMAQTPFVRLFPMELIGFPLDSQLILAKTDHYQKYKPDLNPEEIITAAMKILTAGAQPFQLNPPDPIQLLIKQMLQQPRPKPER